MDAKQLLHDPTTIGFPEKQRQQKSLLQLCRRIVDRIISMGGPVFVRSVIKQYRMSERTSSKEHRCRLLPDVTVANDSITWLNARLEEKRGELFTRTKLQLVIRDLREGHALRSSDVAGALSCVHSH